MDDQLWCPDCDTYVDVININKSKEEWGWEYSCECEVCGFYFVRELLQ